MKDNKATLYSTFSVNKEFSDEDTRFLHVTIDVLHTQKNLNNSFFDKEIVNTYVDSIKNIPILGFVKYDNFLQESDFVGHEYKLVRTKDGIEEVYCGRAYGLVPESCNPRWVNKVCYDGKEREFLQVDAIMWEKFSDATDIVHRDYEKRQSAELQVDSVEGYEDEDGVFHFTKFLFEGLCLLGDHVQEAMVGANVVINDGVNFAMSDIKDSIRSELNDKLEKFNTAFAKFTNDETCSDQGGAKNMLNTDLNQVDENAPEIVEPEAVVAETETEFEETVDAVEVEEVDDKVDETVDGEAETEDEEAEAVEVEEVAEPVVDDNGSFEQTVEVEEVSEVADAEPVTEDSKFSEMQAEIESVKADYSKIKSEYDEMFSSYEKLKSEYESIKSEYDEMKPKYDMYVQAEAQREAEELSAQKDAAFAEYESELSDNAEFAALREKKDEMSIKDIENECAMLFWKMSRAKNKFSAADTQSAVVGVTSEVDSAEADGLVLTKYGYISTGK